MSLRTVARASLIAALAFGAIAATAIARRTASPALTAAGAATLVLCAPVAPIAALRWMRPRTSAMMVATRAGWATSPAGPRPRPGFEWVALERVSRGMWLAAIAAEDAYFRHHSGFDWQSIRDAHAHNRTHAGKRGGSTITQQVAKNLFLWSGRSYARKAVEAGLTVTIEALWPKRRILEVYLNIAQFGEGLFGVEAAARHYFGKPSADLTDAEAALLAAALPNPMRYRVGQPSHQMRFRQSWILAAMRRLGDNYLERL